MQATSFALTLPVMVPLLLAVVIYAVERRSWQLRNGLSVIAALSSFLLVVQHYRTIMADTTLVADFPELLPPLGVSFRMDHLGFLVAAVVSFVWLMVTIYSTTYMAKGHAKNRYYPFSVLTLAGAMGVILSGDLFTFFLFFEVMSLSAYVLVIHEETAEAMRAGYRYLILTTIGGLALLFSIIAVFQQAGVVTFTPGGLSLEANGLAFLAFMGFLVGFGIKAGMVPLHVWLPEAHPVAPTPASALLSGLMLKTGAFGLIRVMFQVFGLEMLEATKWNDVLLLLAAITIFLGSAVAITQDEIKRRLAYSSIGQMGYILLGIGLLQERALIGAIFHIFAHAFMKSSLFLAAGAIIYSTGKRKVSEWVGMGRSMPITMSVFTVAALSMVGVPPLVGFVSKWELALGSLDAGSVAFVVLLLLSSLMNFIYYFPLIQNAFFGEGLAHSAQAKIQRENVPLAMLVPLVVLGLVILVIDLLPYNVVLELAERAAHSLFLTGN